MSTQCYGLSNMSHTNTEPKNFLGIKSDVPLFILYLISCFFLNRISLFTRREEALQISADLAVLYYYKILTLLQSVALFFLDEG